MAFVIGPGFQAKIDELGWTPAGNEEYFPTPASHEYSVCMCEEGVLFYSFKANKVGILPFV